MAGTVLGPAATVAAVPGSSRALEVVASWPVAVAAVGVAGTDGARASAGPIDQPLPWASVTKLLTALAALVAIEERTLDLDEPAGPPGSTIRHLLAHASGLSLEGDGEPAAPGSRRIYSNAGIELAADRLAQSAGMTFKRYLVE